MAERAGSVGEGIVVEYAGARFGDGRLSARLPRVAERCARAPAVGLPRAMESDSELAAAYRFLSNEAVTPLAMLAPHFIQTVERAVMLGRVVIAHDTSELKFSTDRDGLGHLRAQSERGFLMHASLAIAADGSRRPLGLCGYHSWVRGSPLADRKDAAPTADTKESARWEKQVDAVEALFHGRAELLHVMDREGDAYPLIAAMATKGRGFVVRSRIDRIARSEDEAGDERLHEVVRREDEVMEFEVPVAARAKKKLPSSAHPARQARCAKLRVRATTLSIRKPPYVQDAPMWTDVNVVHISEVDAPEGVEPVEWTLLTSEPVDTLKEILAVIEAYRARWIIEEFFKALKTGCEYEKLQLESLAALENALALFCPIAWRMLLLRSVARTEPDAPAEIVLSPTEISVLRTFGARKLSAAPHVAEVLLAVATMGGYVKQKVPPGWLTLARGFEKLSLLTMGWEARDRHDVVNL